MSNIAKSTSPVAPAATESKDWTKASTPELQSGSEDESDVLDAKAKERRRRKQVKREEKQRREEAERQAREEAEARAREEAERAKAEVERKAKEEAECQAREQAEKDRAEVQQRAAEVAARQRALAQEASKKRAREEPEAGPSGDRSNNVRQVFFYFILFPCFFINFLAGAFAVRSTRPSANETRKSPSSARV